MNRNLDGCYFRVQRDGKWGNVCFSDLTKDEMDEVLTGKSTGFLKSLCCYLGEQIRGIGEEFGLVGEDDES